MKVCTEIDCGRSALRSNGGRAGLCRHHLDRLRNVPERSKKRRVARYGLTVAQYDQMVMAQCGACAVCGRQAGEASESFRFDQLVIDHDHATGEVRGLLCASCNLAIGILGDDLIRVRRAADYLVGA